MSPDRSHFSRLAAFCLIALFGIGIMACSDDKVPEDNNQTCTGDDCETTEPCVGDECETTEPCVGDECETTEPCVGDECETTEPCVGDDCDNTEPCVGDDCETADAPAPNCLAVVTTDYGTGGFVILNMETLNFATEENFTTIYQDAGIAATDDALYAVARMGGDNVQKMSFADNYTVDWQYTLRTADDTDSPNGQNMVISDDGDTGFVAMLVGDVRKLNLNPATADDFIIDTVVIPTIDDFDGSHADVGGVKLIDGTLYVLSQGLGDSFQCEDDAYGQVLAYDPATLTPKNVFDGKDHIDLQTCNPGGMVVMGDTLYVQSIGTWRIYGNNADDGGIEAIDLSTGTSKGLILTESEADGRDIFGIYPAFDGSGLWAVLMDPDEYGPMDLYFLDTTGATATLSEDSFFRGNIWGAYESADHIFVNTREGDEDGIAVVDPATGDVDPDNFFVTNLPPQSSVPFYREDGCFDGDE